MLDLITVVYKTEIPLLEIQARSIDQYFQDSQINSIKILINDDDSVANLITKSWWGKFNHKVNIIPLSIFGYTVRTKGWENQQLLKILGASRSFSEWSVVLDAKTFFVKNVTPNLLIDDSNRVCANSLGPQAVFESAINFVQDFFQIKLQNIIGPGGVPFLFHSATVREMIIECEKRSNQNFIDFFQQNVRYPNLITEFYLYSAFVKYKYGNFSPLYAEKQKWNCINIADWQLDKFDELFLNMQKFLTLTVSISSKTWAKLPEEKQLTYLEFLQKKQLISDPKSTQILINNFINSSDLHVAITSIT